MEGAILIIFIIGYAVISAEHLLGVNKTAVALLLGAVCWSIYAAFNAGPVAEGLSRHLSKISEIIFFLVAAMTIVELIDAWQGFRFVTGRISTRHPKSLLWILCWITFFLSAILDNLTTAIVMVTVVQKLVPEKKERMLFAGMIIIAANAGGAWSPIGDVTTTMLWMGGQVSSTGIIKNLFVPSFVCLLVPLVLLTFSLRANPFSETIQPQAAAPRGSGVIFTAGILVFIFVPIFKILFHLPPYIGILLGLGVLWILSELINPTMDTADRRPLSASAALSRIDTSSALFFLGILLSVSALESTGTLANLSAFLARSIGDNRIIVTLLGFLSAVVDNVPLVAASTGMYSLAQYPTDDALWLYLAYCSGTGGSMLIIGSAAGVAVMGMEQINFGWYAKRIGGLALLGYLAGAAVFLAVSYLL